MLICFEPWTSHVGDGDDGALCYPALCAIWAIESCSPFRDLRDTIGLRLGAALISNAQETNIQEFRTYYPTRFSKTYALDFFKRGAQNSKMAQESPACLSHTQFVT